MMAPKGWAGTDVKLHETLDLAIRLSFLDRVNIGQANAGSPGPSLTMTLGLKGDQYQGERSHAPFPSESTL